MLEYIQSDLLTLSNHVSKYCVGMEGNVSAKVDGGLLIKSSGSKLYKLSKDDLVHFNFKGEQLNNFDRKGSMELGFHIFLMGFDGVNFISHTHPSNTLKILSTDLSKTFSNNRIFPDQVIFNGKKSCLVPYAKPGSDLTEVIKICVNSFIKEEGYFPKLILLQNHGIISCGKSIDECIIVSDICEKSAEIFIGSKLLGNQKFLTKYEISELVDDDNEKYRQELLK
jgi:L-fuculose-phosphate aldolase